MVVESLAGGSASKGFSACSNSFHALLSQQCNPMLSQGPEGWKRWSEAPMWWHWHLQHGKVPRFHSVDGKAKRIAIPNRSRMNVLRVHDASLLHDNSIDVPGPSSRWTASARVGQLLVMTIGIRCSLCCLPASLASLNQYATIDEMQVSMPSDNLPKADLSDGFPVPKLCVVH